MAAGVEGVWRASARLENSADVFAASPFTALARGPGIKSQYTVSLGIFRKSKSYSAYHSRYPPLLQRGLLRGKRWSLCARSEAFAKDEAGDALMFLQVLVNRLCEKRGAVSLFALGGLCFKSVQQAGPENR